MSIRLPRLVLRLAFCAGALAASSGDAAAQLAPVQSGVGATYETYHFGDAEAAGIESLSLLTFPFAAVVPLLSLIHIPSPRDCS